MHQRGIGVIVDWVPAHFPRDEWSLGRFDGTPLYEHPDPRRGEHPEWGTYVFDFGRNEVRNFLVANALYLLDEFHIDGLRVDAVASMLYLDYSRDAGGWVPNEFGGRENLDAIRFLRETNAVVGEEFPDVLMIAEESTAWPGVTAPTSAGGLGFSHKWNLGWMHDSLGYMAFDPIHRRHHHNEMTFALLYAYDERFVLPLSHDEVVHGKGSLLAKIGGDDWQRFAGLRALLAWQWALPGSPLRVHGSRVGAVAGVERRLRTAVAPARARRAQGGPRRGADDQRRGRRMARAVAARQRAGWVPVARRRRRRSQHVRVRPLGHGGRGGRDLHRQLHARWRGPATGSGLPWGGDWRVVLDTDNAAYWGSGLRGLEDDVVTAADPAVSLAVARDVRPTRHRSDVDGLARQHRPTPALPVTVIPVCVRISAAGIPQKS